MERMSLRRLTLVSTTPAERSTMTVGFAMIWSNRQAGTMISEAAEEEGSQGECKRLCSEGIPDRQHEAKEATADEAKSSPHLVC